MQRLDPGPVLAGNALRVNGVDVVIGTRGPIAPPEMCNGLMVPIVGFDWKDDDEALTTTWSPTGFRPNR